MPRLANEKQDLYCKHRANGFLPRKAAIAAGYRTGSAIYTELEKSEEIIARIGELMEEGKARREAMRAKAIAQAQTVGALTGVTHAWVIEQLKLNAEEAREAQSFKESNEALKMIGEHLGMFGAAAPEGRPGADQLQQVINGDILDRLSSVTSGFGEEDEEPQGVQLEERHQAMALIEGHVGKNMTRDRQLATGSETDVALTIDDIDPLPPEEA